jgi:hypothetical protein
MQAGVAEAGDHECGRLRLELADEARSGSDHAVDVALGLDARRPFGEREALDPWRRRARRAGAIDALGHRDGRFD